MLINNKFKAAVTSNAGGSSQFDRASLILGLEKGVMVCAELQNCEKILPGVSLQTSEATTRLQNPPASRTTRSMPSSMTSSTSSVVSRAG